MALRLIELFLPEGSDQNIAEILAEEGACECLGVWQQSISQDQSLIRILVDAEQAEKVLDALNGRFSSLTGFRLVLLSVEATLPRLESSEEKDEKEGPEEEKEKISRLSREELYADIIETVKLSKTFIVLVILSSLVAAVGLVRGNVAVIIGAMVIAPLLGPSMAFCLATTLGDLSLARRALKANSLAVGTTLGVAILIGFALAVTPDGPQIALRTRAGLPDVVLALASGGAGALSFTMGISAALVGVMVAVALLPPLVVGGMLIGSGHWISASGALLLVVINLICINLSGTVAFVAQGIRPTTWWESDRAGKATRIAIVSWILLLTILTVSIALS